MSVSLLTSSAAVGADVEREVEAVMSGKRAPLSFLSSSRQVEFDWALIEPNGMYARDPELRRLWWVSRYMRVYLEVWSGEFRAEFESLLRHDPETPGMSDLAPTVLRSQFGT